MLSTLDLAADSSGHPVRALAGLPAPGLDDAGNEFNGAGVYTKDKYFLHALRHKLGDDGFYTSLRAVLTEYADRNISMPELRDELATRTGVDLTSFWAEWMGTRKPSTANLYPGPLGG